MQNRRKFLKHLALFGGAAFLPSQNLLAESSVGPIGEGAARTNNRVLRQAKKQPRTITIPNVGEFRVLKGDFHIHTLYSDGAVMPKDRVKEAIDNGLDVISITDHLGDPIRFINRVKLAINSAKSVGDNNAAYILAKSEADKHNLLLVQGTELTKKMTLGHLNALFIQDANAIESATGDWRKVLAIAASQGAFIHWNHPGSERFTEDHAEACTKGLLHGVEVYNSTKFYPHALDWCNQWNLAPFANSDIHKSEESTYESRKLRPMTLILAKDRSLVAVREAFFARRTIGWAENLVFGRSDWIEKLFCSCIDIQRSGETLRLRNLSDIPCDIVADNLASKLTPQGAAEIRGRLPKKLVVTNWFVGANKPLEIALS